jgi:hypothetical protein
MKYPNLLYFNKISHYKNPGGVDYSSPGFHPGLRYKAGSTLKGLNIDRNI